MNVKKNLTMLTFAAMIAVGSLASAQENNAETVPKPAEGQSIARIQIKGVVEKINNDVILLDGETTYLLKGEKDLDSFAGKTVMVTGDGYASDAGMVLLVKQIAELK